LREDIVAHFATSHQLVKIRQSKWSTLRQHPYWRRLCKFCACLQILRLRKIANA
jgi:hypothetical protein